MKRFIESLIFFLIISLFLLSSCCGDGPKEIARYELKSDELALLPYKLGQKINFIHTNAYSFDFKVVEDKIEWKEESDLCEYCWCGADYYSYQVKTSILESTYPRFYIEFTLGDSRLSDYQPHILNIKINNKHFIQFPYDEFANFISDSSTNTIYFDSISLNNKMFYKVIMKDFDRHSFINDSTILVPKSLYFNDLGMIQLKMSNDETYTINN